MKESHIYVICTVQYGIFEEEEIHEGIESLLDDMANIVMLDTVQIVSIEDNGRELSDHEIDLLQDAAKARAQQSLRSCLSDHGVI